MVAINAKEIYRFEVRALKRFIQRFMVILKETLSSKGHLIDDSSEHKFNLHITFRAEFVMRKLILTSAEL